MKYYFPHFLAEEIEAKVRQLPKVALTLSTLPVACSQPPCGRQHRALHFPGEEAQASRG